MDSPAIFITGAGKGIGKAIVEKIISRRDELRYPRLFLTSRTESDLAELRELAENVRLKCEIFPAELTTDPQAFLKFGLEKAGRIDVLFHSAGVGRFGDLLELTRKDYEFVFETNVRASFELMQSTYRQMKKQKSGSVVWITSIASETPFEQSALYCMSKYAQRGLIDVMRLYARKDGIRIIEVKPGATYTPMWGDIPETMQAQMIDPSDVAMMAIDAIRIPQRASVEEILIRPLRGDV